MEYTDVSQTESEFITEQALQNEVVYFNIKHFIIIIIIIIITITITIIIIIIIII